MTTGVLCLAHFARDWEKIVTTDVTGTGLGISLGQKQSDNTIRPTAFANIFLNDTDSNQSESWNN